MEMGQPARNGGGKVVTFDDAVAGRRRNGSLSSYLDAGRDVEAAAAGRAARPPLAPGMGSRRRRTYADDELDVFTAERYFKGAMDGDAAVAAPPLVEAAAAAWPAAAVVLAKPSSTRASTVSSASSANSQTALFPGGHRRRGGSKCGCVHVGMLMRTCSGKRSVRVDDGGAAAATTTNNKGAHGGGGGEPAARRIDWYRELRMHKAAIVGLPGDDGSSNNHGVVAAAALPPSSLNLGAAKVAAIGRDEKAAELACSSITRRSFTLVAPVRTSVVPASHGRVGGGAAGGAGGKGEEEEEDDYDGGGSESSSDLFEIKSLMIEDCPYEPSEASIQWSVVTADASSERGGGGGRGPVGGRQHHRPVGLLAGCASHRAVDVSSAVAKAVPSPAAMMQRRGDGFQKARRSNGA